MKVPVEVQPPGCDRLFVVLRVEEPGEPSSFTPLVDLPLDLDHGATVESMVNELPS